MNTSYAFTFHFQSALRPGFRVAAILLLLCTCLPATANVLIASWNLKHLGWADEKRDWERTAQIVTPFDFVAIQEVHSVGAVRRLASLLNQTTSDNWKYLVSSEAVGSKRYKEFYAFMWKEASVEYTGFAATYLDPDRDFFREPFSAVFTTREDGYSFLAANLHVIYGDSVSQRAAEADKLDEYVDWLRETFVDPERLEGLFLMGDFNLPPSNPAFDDLRSVLRPAKRSGASTLSKANWKYSNLYDNIWFRGIQPEFSGIFAFPSLQNVTHRYARKHISDHAPLFIRLPERDQ